MNYNKVPSKQSSLIGAIVVGIGAGFVVFILCLSFVGQNIFNAILDGIFLGFIPAFHFRYVANRRGDFGGDYSRYVERDKLVKSIGLSRSGKWFIYVLGLRLIIILLQIPIILYHIIMGIISIKAIKHFIEIYYIEDRYKKENRLSKNERKQKLRKTIKEVESDLKHHNVKDETKRKDLKCFLKNLKEKLKNLEDDR